MVTTKKKRKKNKKRKKKKGGNADTGEQMSINASAFVFTGPSESSSLPAQFEGAQLGTMPMPTKPSESTATATATDGGQAPKPTPTSAAASSANPFASMTLSAKTFVPAAI